MTQWTKEAHELWNRFADEARTRFDTGEVDPNEVLDDMRRHVEAELDARGLAVVTAEDLRTILNRLELPNAAPKATEHNPVAAPAAQSPTRPPHEISWGAGVYIFIFGVLLPIGAISLELLTRICTTVFFDPLPTVWHVALFAAIPLFNMIGVLCIQTNAKRSFRWMGFFNAVAIGVAIFYTVWFLPLLPFSAFAIIALGIGLCGWAPLLSLIACVMVRTRLRLLTEPTPAAKVPFFWKGSALGAGALALLFIPPVATVIGLHMAVSENPNTRAAAYKLMRTLGSEDYLLNRCYDFGDIRPFGFDITGTAGISTDTIRGIYYRVTGQAFNTRRPSMDFFGARDSWLDEWDFEEAGDNVGGRLKNLSLISSQIDANCQGDGVVGYLEWIMVFQNDSQWNQREARCQLQLPPGGVVSRLTLWIDGRECEAAFGGRSQTKGAYQAVVSRRRDPVLVTTKGPDQVLLQCFPVEPNGGRMKVRVGITFPLDLISKQEALLQLPYMNQRNFGIPETTVHQVWIEADSQLTAALKTLAASQESGRHTLRGPLSNEQLEQQLAAVHVVRNPDVTQVWAKNDTTGTTVLQQLQNQQDPTLVDRVVIVLDTSAPMKAALDEIEAALESRMHDSDYVIVTADDTPETYKPGQWPTWRRAGFKGGKDNMPALVRAWDLAADGSAPIVWIHAAQPHLFDSTEALTQRWNRRPEGPTLYHVQTAPGPNVIVEALDGVAQVRAVARSADLKADLERLFGRLRGTIPTYHFSRRPLTAEPDPAVKQASSHIVRLWAREQVDALRTREKSRNEAIELAVRHQLVTPVSGAVVLERKEQYDQHGLEPVDPDTVPTIPEPATLLLMGLGTAILAKTRKQKKTAGQKPAVLTDN